MNVQFESDEEVREERLRGGGGASALSPRAQPLRRGTAFVPLYSVMVGSGHRLGLGCLCQEGEAGLF